MALKKLPRNLALTFVAETFGTMVLAATALTALAAHLGGADLYRQLYFPFLVGGVVMMLVATIGSVSGAHLNPAVSLAQFMYRKVSFSHMLVCLAGQLLGAWIGGRLALELTGIPSITPVAVDRAAAFGELVGTAILVFAVMRVVQGKVAEGLSGITIGMALAVGLSLALVTGAGVLNPAIALAVGAPALVYLLVPVVGGMVGGALAQLFEAE